MQSYLLKGFDHTSENAKPDLIENKYTYIILVYFVTLITNMTMKMAKKYGFESKWDILLVYKSKNQFNHQPIANIFFVLR